MALTVRIAIPIKLHRPILGVPAGVWPAATGARVPLDEGSSVEAAEAGDADGGSQLTNGFRAI
jgi:hypothetical protein